MSEPSAAAAGSIDAEIVQFDNVGLR